MGVQAAIALLNGSDADPVAPSLPGKRLPKPTSSNWTPKQTTAVKSGNKIKDNALNRTEPASTIPSKATTVATVPTVPTIIPTTKSALKTSNCVLKSSTIIDMLIEELTAQYQEALDKNDSTKDIISKLESDVELYACDSTKVRDYEIRVEYLAQKLEQVSEERDLLEQELSTYKDRHGSLVTPVSPAFGPDVFGGKSTMIEAVPAVAAHPKNDTSQQHNESSKNNDTIEKQHQEQQQHLEDIYFDEILDAYEERRSMDNGDFMQQQEHNEQMMAQMLAEYDQGMKMAMEVYVADLEKQRLENKTLQAMVKKQDELIKKLENKCDDTHQSDDYHLLENSKEDQRLSHQQQRTLPSVRSSIDILAEIARNDGVPGSSLGPIHQHHHQRDTGRNTPPPFAPPKTPLPPLPASEHSNTSVNNGSLISYSRSSTSSTTWSSDEQHQQHYQQQQHHPLPTTTTCLPPKHNSIDRHHHMDDTALVGGTHTFGTDADSSAITGSFWNGLKKKF